MDLANAFEMQKKRWGIEFYTNQIKKIKEINIDIILIWTEPNLSIWARNNYQA